MTSVVLSPHTDDAVFSIGEHLCSLGDVVVVSPMAAIPSDPAGRVKHETLRAEHAAAMEVIGGDYLNGPFLDDVYPAPHAEIFAAWMNVQLAQADTVYVPLGIRHHDHLMVSNTAIAYLLEHSRPTVRVYAEMPYRARFPGLAQERLDLFRSLLGELKPLDEVSNRRGTKERALRAYRSQTDEQLITELLVPEHIWELS